MKTYFDHEKLNVYQVSLKFNEWVGDFLASIEAKAAAKDHLDRAATSVPLNIAEGNGNSRAKIARVSLILRAALRSRQQQALTSWCHGSSPTWVKLRRLTRNCGKS